MLTIHRALRNLAASMVVLLALAFSAASPASGALILMLDDGLGNTATVSDADNDGIVLFNGSLGTWNINISTGLGFPALGAANYPRTDLNSINVSGGAGTLMLWLTETDLSNVNNSLQLVLNIGGTTNGSLNATAYADSSNTAFGTGTTLAALGPFSGGAFSGYGSGIASTNGPFSMTTKITIAHGAGTQNSSFNAELAGVPEPATLTLFGGALLGLAFLRRKKTTR